MNLKMNYAWDYETVYYHIYGVSDIVDDDVFEFILPLTDENTALVEKFIIALDGIAATGGKRNDCSHHIDCQLDKRSLKVDSYPLDLAACTAENKTPPKQPTPIDILHYLKRLTVYANRAAQHLRGERNV